MIDYELDIYRHHENGNIELVAILTGLPDEEIEKACPAKDLWGGQTFVRIFKKLGFNTSERFEKFDPYTDKPCIMRTTSERKDRWCAWVYYKGIIYEDPLNELTVKEWQEKYPDFKITSMLQVWI